MGVYVVIYERKDKKQAKIIIINYIMGDAEMNVIKIDIGNPDDAQELLNMADQTAEIDVIQERGFNGDITTIELYISMAVNVITIIVSMIGTLIQHKKVSSLKINGETIEISNVSQELVERIMREKLGGSETGTNDNGE